MWTALQEYHLPGLKTVLELHSGVLKSAESCVSWMWLHYLLIPAFYACLCQLDQQLQHVGDALSGNGGRGHNVDILPRVRVLPVQRDVEPLLVQIQNRALQVLLEFCLHVGLLGRQRVLDGRVRVGRPFEQPVNLHSTWSIRPSVKCSNPSQAGLQGRLHCFTQPDQP